MTDVFMEKSDNEKLLYVFNSTSKNVLNIFSTYISNCISIRNSFDSSIT